MAPATPPPPPPDPVTQAALRTLKDIVVPPPVSWFPQTWGWAVLALIVAVIAVILILHWLKRYRADRYRREALRELDALKAQWNAPSGDEDAVAALAVLLKRVALAAYPRREVAALTGAPWTEFLRNQTGGTLDPALAAMLDDGEYRKAEKAATGTPSVPAIASGVRQWIEEHHVRP